MKISFVIPAYNEEALIGKCLESVEQELARGNYDAEVVVVNNASTDNTKKIAESFADIRVVDEPKKGLVQARRAGFEATNGELVANIDSDTIVPEGWLAHVYKEFSHDSSLVGLSGPYVYYDLPWHKRTLVYPWYFLGWAFFGFRIQGGNFVIRRDAWEKVGGFDTSIAFYGEDTDVAERLKKVGRVKFSWKLVMHSTGRRLQKEGLCMTSFHYGMNFVWIVLFKRPFTRSYRDIRLK